MIEDLNWDSLALRRQQTRLTTMYKISHNLIEVDKAKFINLASEQRTRGTRNFKYFIEHSNKDAHRFSFYPRTIREWNKHFIFYSFHTTFIYRNLYIYILFLFIYLFFNLMLA